MSDATGMLQHSIFSIPDRRHGYCIDDNARALILMHGVDDLDEVLRDKWTTIYASFVQYRVEPRPAPVPQLHALRPHLVRGCRVRRIRTAVALWALGITARDARLPEASRLGFGAV